MLNPHTERATQLEGFLKLDPDNAALLGELAECHHRGGNQERAPEIQARLGGRAAAAPLSFNLGYAQLGAGAAKEAVPNLSRAVELGLADPRTRYVLAVALEEAGEADKAEREGARVVELEPLHHDGLTLAAHLQIAKGRIAEARATLERLVEAHPSSPNALWLRAQLEMLNFDAARALEYLRRAEALAPQDADILIAQAQANLMLQRAGPD